MMKCSLGFKFAKITLALALLLGSSASPAQSAPEDASKLFFPFIIRGFVNGPATVTGIVRDASNGVPLDNAEVCYGAQCDNTDDTGRYVLENIPSGYRTLLVTSPEYSSVSETVWVIGLRSNEKNFALVSGLSIGGIYMRIVATWSSNPSWPGTDCGGIPCENDLDGLLWLDLLGSIEVIDPSNIGECSTYPNACHEHDARHGSGPETVAIRQLNYETMYYYGVLNVYQGVPGVPLMPYTGAIVRVYDETGFDETFTVPPVGSGDFWYLFTIDSMNVLSPTITFLNCLTTLPGSGEVPQCPVGAEIDGRTYYLPPITLDEK